MAMLKHCHCSSVSPGLTQISIIVTATGVCVCLHACVVCVFVCVRLCFFNLGDLAARLGKRWVAFSEVRGRTDEFLEAL